MRAEGKEKETWLVTLCSIRGITSPFIYKKTPKNTDLVFGADRERFHCASCWVLQPRTNSHWGNNYFSSMGQRGGNPGGGGEPFCFFGGFFFNPACANTCLRQLSSQHMMRQRVACLNLVQNIDTEGWIKKRAERLSNQAKKKQNILLVICTSTCMTLRWRCPRKHTRCKTFVFFLFLAMSMDCCERVLTYFAPCTPCLQPSSQSKIQQIHLRLSLYKFKAIKLHRPCHCQSSRSS